MAGWPHLPDNPLMRIAIGADHAGFEMKRDLAGHLAKIDAVESRYSRDQ